MIQKQLVDKLALKILEGEFGEGDTVRVDAADGELSLREGAEPVAAALACGLETLQSSADIRLGFGWERNPRLGLKESG